MKYLAIRADDLGLSEAVNYGILKCVKTGLVKTVEVMSNMPATVHGLDLLKDRNVVYGLHTNFSTGKPISNPNLVPSLVDEAGNFHKSSYYHNAIVDPVILEEALIEVEAQLLKLKEYLGRMPDYIAFHAIVSMNFFKALNMVAQKYNLRYFNLTSDLKNIKVGCHRADLYCGSQIDKGYNPINWMKDVIKAIDDESYNILVFHTGYIDKPLLDNSSLTYTRCNEVAALCDDELIRYINESNCHLIDYLELFGEPSKS